MALAAALLTLAVAGSATAAIPPSRTTTTPAPEHVVVIVFENHEADSILAPHSDAPYFRSLARSSVRLSRLFAIAHPSLPNYLALTSGSTHGITSDCTTCYVDGPNIVSQLERASITWKAYMESIPGPCSTVAADGTYAMKHDPFMYYTERPQRRGPLPQGGPAATADVGPPGRLVADVRVGHAEPVSRHARLRRGDR